MNSLYTHRCIFFVALARCTIYSASASLEEGRHLRGNSIPKYEARQLGSTYSDSSASTTTTISQIIDGTVAQPDRYPYFASILHSDFAGFFSSSICGGTLIADQWILSAAHCIDEANLPNKVRVGAYGQPGLTIDNGGASYQERDIAEMVPHPKYDPQTTDYDFALFKLDKPVTDQYLLSNIMELDYTGDTDNSLDSGDTLTVIGLGQLDEGDVTSISAASIPSYLQQVDLEYISNFECRVRGWPLLSSRMMCAMDPNTRDQTNEDACFGDSGGPLIATRNGRDVQVGVVSFGSGCGTDVPGVYARISSVSNWISSTIATSAGEEDNGGGENQTDTDDGGSLLDILKSAVNTIEDEMSGLSTGEKAGVVVGVLVAFAILLKLIRSCCCRRKAV